MPVALTLLSVLSLHACLERAKLPPEAGFGPDPTLPEPNTTALPTVKVAKATGWSGDAAPTPAAGLEVRALARGLDHPRWLYVLPNGDVLVAETNAPPRPEEGKGLRGKAMKVLMKKAGSAVPSADRITLLRDADGNGILEVRAPLLTGLHSPFGIALVGDRLYVANTDAVVRFPYREGETRITAAPEKVADLPAGPRNHHWTKSLVASRDGKRLYVGVGSNSNVGEHGLDEEERRAAILEIDADSGRTRVFASGLRNPVGMAWLPGTDVLWVAVNERDELGSDLVPDYMTSVRDGGFYGWPFSYFGTHVDARVKPGNPEMVAKAIVPDYALGAHTASLGLVFYEGTLLPERYRGGAFVGQHGSWNRRPPIGYKVIFVPFAGGKPAGPPEDVLTGFLLEDGRALGRPVGVAVDRSGALLVADDVGNAVWRVTPRR
jgi:glucose/arabinose dehydrogenase